MKSQNKLIKKIKEFLVNLLIKRKPLTHTVIYIYIYSGYSDYVCCFSCGGSLSEWRPNDDPWVEHAYWFPECTFVLQNKGEEFVQQIQLVKKADDEQVNILL